MRTRDALDFDSLMTRLSDEVVERMVAAVPDLQMTHEKTEALRFWVADNILEKMSVGQARALIQSLALGTDR